MDDDDYRFFALPRDPGGTPELVDVLKLPDHAGVAIILKAKRFRDAPDALTALDLVVMCNQVGLYPPEAVLAWLANGIERWNDDLGDVSLDEVLGVPDKRAMKRELIKQRDQNLMDCMARLTHLGATVDQAAYATWKWFTRNPWDQTGKLDPVAKATIIDKWNSHGAQTWSHDLLRKGLAAWATLPENVHTFLRGFEEGDLPSSLNMVRKQQIRTMLAP